MSTDVDVDRDVAVAWHRFRYRLAACLADLRIGERLVVETPAVIGTSTSVVAERHGRSLVVGAATAMPRQEHVGSDEAAVAALVTRWLRGHLAVLHPVFLSARIERGTAIRSLRGDLTSASPRGASAPGMTAITVTSPQHLHALVKPILEEVLGHPAERDEDGDYVLDAVDPAGSGDSAGSVGSEDSAVPAYVRVRDNVPVLEILTTLHPVESYAAGVAEANALNTTGPLLFHFAVVDNQLVGRMEIWCFAFVPDQVRAMLRSAMGRLEELSSALGIECADDCSCGDCADGPDCADGADGPDGADCAVDDVEVGPATAMVSAAGDADDADDSDDSDDADDSDGDSESDDDSDEALRAELAALLGESDPAGGEGIEPELIARICGWDSSLILDFIRVCEFEALECRLSAGDDPGGCDPGDLADLADRGDLGDPGDPGDPALAAVREHEVRSWEATAEVLLRALRVTVERA